MSPSQLYVTPGYLEALRVPLKRGRLFTESDTEHAPGVVILDERLAQRFWPNADPIGRRMYLPSTPDDVAKPGPKVTWLTVVGIVATVKLAGLDEGENTRVGAYYLPIDQDPTRGIGLAIRWKSGEAAAIKSTVERALAEIDPNVQLYDSFVMTERIDRSLDPRRAPMLLSVAFGIVALLLASLGIYGVLAYQVSQRTREIGIRIALGSGAGDILRLVLREAIVLVLVGLVVRSGRHVRASGRHRLSTLRRGRARPARDPCRDSRAGRRWPLRVRRPGAPRDPRRSSRRAAGLASSVMLTFYDNAGREMLIEQIS